MRFKSSLAAFVALAVMLIGPAHSHASGTRIWTGGGSGLWSDTADWSGGTIPGSGDDVLFPTPITPHPTSTMDIPGLSIHSLTFAAEDYQINADNSDDPLTVTSLVSDTATVGVPGDCSWIYVPLHSSVLTVDASGSDQSLLCLAAPVTVATSTTFTGSQGTTFISTANILGSVIATTGFAVADVNGAFGSGTIEVDTDGGIQFWTGSGDEAFANTFNVEGGELFANGGGTVTLSGSINVIGGNPLSDMSGINNSTIDVSGSLTGADPLSLFDQVKEVFTGNISGYSGTMTVGDNGDPSEAVTALIESTGSFPVRVEQGGILGGNGTVGNVVGSRGTVSPGDSPGRLTTGSLTMQSRATFAAELNGSVPGTSYDQVVANGLVTLGGTLNATLGFVPSGSTSFTIIKNTSGQPVSGTFSGLPEGSTLTIGGIKFSITYVGGTSGRDVVLTTPPVVVPVPFTGGAL